MAEHKKQHYVPQFYLKNFSGHPEKKFINIFHIASEKHIPSAKIQDQAQKDYFYSNELIFEKALSDIESLVAGLIQEIFQKKDVPRYLSPEHHALLAFSIFQHYRTLYAADSIDEHVDKLIKIFFRDHPEFGNQLDSFNIRMTEPARFVLSVAASIIPLAYDLRMKLLINETSEGFIASDNPCVMINPFLRVKKSHGGKHGIANKGLMILLPLSPEYALIIYDDYRYKIGGRKMKPVIVRDPKDIAQVNSILYLNSHKSIYYKDNRAKCTVDRLHEQYHSLRRNKKVIVNEYAAKERNSTLIHSYAEEVRASFSPSFLKLTPMAMTDVVRNHAEQVRDYYLCRKYEDFQKELKKGTYKVSQFYEYIEKTR